MLLSATLLLILNFFLPVISTLAALRFPCFVLFLSAAISLWDFLNLLPLGIKRHIVGNNGRFGFTLKDKEALNVVTFVEELGRLFREEVRFRAYPLVEERRLRRLPVHFMEVDDVALSPVGDAPVVLSSRDVLCVYGKLVQSGAVDFGFIGRVHGGAQNVTTYNFHEGKAASDVEKGEYVGHHLLITGELYEVTGLHRSTTDDHTRWTVERLSKEERAEPGILIGWIIFHPIQPVNNVSNSLYFVIHAYLHTGLIHNTMDMSRSDVFSSILATVGSSELCGRRLKKAFPGQTTSNWGSVRGYSPIGDVYVSSKSCEVHTSQRVPAHYLSIAPSSLLHIFLAYTL